MQLRAGVLLLAVVAGAVFGRVCYVGNEPDSSGRMRWVLPYRDPCSCSELRLDGLRTQAPSRRFQPVYLDSPVITKDRGVIRRLLNCKAPIRLLSNLVCEDGLFKMTCGKGESIDIQGALYGRENGTAFCFVNRAEPCGNATSSLAIVRQKCPGKIRSCNITAATAAFGGDDPCPGVGKYLAVNFTCKHDP